MQGCFGSSRVLGKPLGAQLIDGRVSMRLRLHSRSPVATYKGLGVFEISKGGASPGARSSGWSCCPEPKSARGFVPGCQYRYGRPRPPPPRCPPPLGDAIYEEDKLPQLRRRSGAAAGVGTVAGAAEAGASAAAAAAAGPSPRVGT
jgi:hypothetical protein